MWRWLGERMFSSLSRVGGKNNVFPEVSAPRSSQSAKHSYRRGTLSFYKNKIQLRTMEPKACLSRTEVSSQVTWWGDRRA